MLINLLSWVLTSRDAKTGPSQAKQSHQSAPDSLRLMDSSIYLIQLKLPKTSNHSFTFSVSFEFPQISGTQRKYYMLELRLSSQDFRESGSHPVWSCQSAISHLSNFGLHHERAAISAHISQSYHITIKRNLHHLKREDVDACQSGNVSRVIPKAPGPRWIPASYISYKWRNCGTAMNLPRRGHPAKTSLSSVSIKILQMKKKKKKKKHF